jgi:hypothetical protein
MVVPTEDEAAAAENVATHGKKVPVEKAITGREAASVKNSAANNPGGKKAPVQASGGKKVPRGKKAPVQSTTVEASGGKKAPVHKSVTGIKGDSMTTTASQAPSGNKGLLLSVVAGGKGASVEENTTEEEEKDDADNICPAELTKEVTIINNTCITNGCTTCNNSSEKGCLLLWLWVRCLKKQSLLHLHQEKGNGVVLSP